MHSNLPLVHKVMLFSPVFKWIHSNLEQSERRNSSGSKPPIEQPSVDALQPWPLWISSPGGIQNNFSNIQPHLYLLYPICAEMTLKSFHKYVAAGTEKYCQQFTQLRVREEDV